ncbi:hypothetical protein RHSIM_Rhsim13G0220700 [Rhododendron simsii]|uniref:Uncharacterized protein n=1 Tax=Rhododendron simsii TaxID=118357 RepID=A0A834L7P0_RHOSS|nr:hypothetical protein RHSIM_Rhsim13G0220700 [Rhododendron simsii]
MIILHQQFLSLQPHPQALLPLSLITKRCRTIPVSGFGLVRGDVEVPGKRVRRFTNLDSRRRRAVERESEFEVDPDKAREALRKLDQQLESISQKQIDPRPKIIVPDLDLGRDQMREEMPEYSPSFLAYLAFSLLIFTVFYNVLFITVIKPAIDGPEPAADTSVREAPYTPASR